VEEAAAAADEEEASAARRRGIFGGLDAAGRSSVGSAARGAVQRRRSHGRRFVPLPPNLGMSRHAPHAPQLGVVQATHLPHRTIRRRFSPLPDGAAAAAVGANGAAGGSTGANT
jgi:hypothetical protein